MKMFKKAIAVMLLIVMALLPVSGLCEFEIEETNPETTAFETLQKLMSDPLSPDIQVAEGIPYFADIVTEEQQIENKLPSRTPDGVLCQILFNESKIIISGVSKIKKDTEESVDITGEETEAEYEDKYEAVVYSDLKTEQLLYYAYIVSINYTRIQDLMPLGESFSIVVKFGDASDDLLLINDSKLATEFTGAIVNLVGTLSGATSAE